MKTEYRYIHFVWLHIDGMWQCRNNRTDDVLGWVEWYDPWRQYIFMAAYDNTIFSADCLADIQDFIGKVTAVRKDEKVKN